MSCKFCRYYKTESDSREIFSFLCCISHQVPSCHRVSYTVGRW